MKLILFLLFISCCAHANPVSHEAVYHVGLASTKGGASSVVAADGTLRYRVQKKCDLWHTETVFSLDVSYELSGIDTTNWKQTTVESLDGCRFDFEVHVRENGRDRKELSGTARCENGKKQLHISFPVPTQAEFPKTVKFPLEQTVSWLQAAQKGEKSFSSYVFDGTRPDALMFMNAVVMPGSAETLKGLKSYRFDFAFYPAFKDQQPDGTPMYESAARYDENGVADEIRQDFGTYVLKSERVSLTMLDDLPCEK